MKNFTCRACESSKLTSFLDLGITPLSNAIVPFNEGDKGEICYPLHAFICANCFLVQLGEFESPENIFSNDYVYFSSFSSSWLAHAKQYSTMMVDRFNLEQDSHVAEVASNDGYLLQWFKKAGLKVTGIEPAGNCAEAARKIGVHTLSEFFGEMTAKEIARQRGKADVIAANNVLAHVPNILDFLAGFKELLKPQGVATFEFPHLLNLMELNQFDTIYHEHFSYLALRPVMNVLAKVGLRVFDVEEWSTHGGSLRLFVCQEDADHSPMASVKAILAKETKAGLYNLATYQDFTENVRNIKDGLLQFLITARKEKKNVVAYGAAAKGATLLNYCGVGQEYISYIVDKNPNKQQRFFPGVRIPIHPVEKLLTDNPDYILILPWNLKEEISRQLRDDGVSAKFVTAIPELSVQS